MIAQFKRFIKNYHETSENNFLYLTRLNKGLHVKPAQELNINDRYILKIFADDSAIFTDKKLNIIEFYCL